MKIIGQSTIIATPPYMHLGYVATTMLHYSKPLTDVCLGLILAGLLIGFRFRTSGKGWLAKTHVLLRRPMAWGIAGMCMVLIGLLTLILAPARYTSVYSKPSMLTFTHMVKLHTNILTQLDQGVPIPNSIQELAKDDPNSIQDVWGTQLKFEKTTQNGKENCRFTSSGPDKLFGTPDDIVWPREENETAQSDH